MTNIPELEDSGSDGTQETESEQSSLAIVPESAFDKIPLVKTMEGLVADRARSMGGEVAARLLAGSFDQISHELTEAKNELRQTRVELKETNENLTDCKEKSAVLGERVRSGSRNKHLQNISIFAGTTFVGISIELYRNNLEKFAYMVGGLGILMIVLGWFSTPGRET